MLSKRKYLLTETAEQDFVEAKNWSMNRWGRKRTISYFTDIEKCANNLADRHLCRIGLSASDSMTSDDELLVWPVNEHYLVYLPVRKGLIVIVSLIRQTRDVPSILAAHSFTIARQVNALKKTIEALFNSLDGF
jgi:plasmid stabilization system protein ParE